MRIKWMFFIITLFLLGKNCKPLYGSGTDRELTLYESGVIDTFQVGEFLLTHQYYEDRGDSIWGGQFKIYRNDTLLIASRIWPYYGIDYCCFNPVPDTFPDINKDGIRDVTFAYAGGGTAALESAVIYDLDSVAIEIGFFDGMNTLLGATGPAQVDSDSIPEITAPDFTYRDTYFYPGGPMPWLVWKWDPEIGRAHV
jgi:hypothetical protein